MSEVAWCPFIALGETIGMLTIDSELPNAFTEIRRSDIHGICKFCCNDNS